MPAGKTFAPLRGKRMRITKLDECGVPVLGPASTRVSKGFVSIAMSPQYQDATAISVVNASGETDFTDAGDDEVTGMQATITFTRVDPDLYSLISGHQVVVDGAATAVGFRLSGGNPVTGGWALESWSDLGGQACAGLRSYGYFLLPYLRGGRLGDFTLENGAASFSMVSRTRENAGWGTGPYDVLNTGTVEAPVPGPLLSAIGPKDYFHLQETNLAPPAETAGLVALAA
jgi:hypothetical protein